MGSWSANYQLYLAAAGEQGWADAINGNFEIIDTELKTQTGAIAAASLTAEWDKIAGKPTIYPSAWNEISGKPDFSMVTHRGIPLIVETPQTTPFNATGEIENYQTVTLATVNGYVLGSPLVINVSTKDTFPSQPKQVTLSAGGVSCMAFAGLPCILTVPVGRKITTITLLRTGSSGGNVEYTCSGSLQTSVLSFMVF